mmetsp:Transcript_89302/g.186620  ORF Transcript_89302/g.186620 Transcript_89302/m.186620 type:complete len:322 (+) Transcript_89302:351-1316(+)
MMLKTAVRAARHPISLAQCLCHRRGWLLRQRLPKVFRTAVAVAAPVQVEVPGSVAATLPAVPAADPSSVIGGGEERHGHRPLARLPDRDGGEALVALVRIGRVVGGGLVVQCRSVGRYDRVTYSTWIGKGKTHGFWRPRTHGTNRIHCCNTAEIPGNAGVQLFTIEFEALHPMRVVPDSTDFHPLQGLLLLVGQIWANPHTVALHFSPTRVLGGIPFDGHYHTMAGCQTRPAHERRFGGRCVALGFCRLSEASFAEASYPELVPCIRCEVFGEKGRSRRGFHFCKHPPAGSRRGLPVTTTVSVASVLNKGRLAAVSGSLCL